ncbi:Uma2 family endonuclease [Microcoleus sp. N9_B2]|uniref:Uma2 family endonuclease n=1 Tax=unclassified Microcoleus TaxID=2642155 RepID=UPI002FD3A121
MYIPDSQSSQAKVLPTMYDLPSEDPEEAGLPDEYHRWQAQLLCDSCLPSNYPADRVFSASDLNLYYDSNHLNWYKRPDWYLVVGVSRFYQDRDLRQSYVIWDEVVSPLIAIEFLSPSTEDEDLGLTESEPNKPPTKWQVYEKILKIPYYFVFSKYNNKLRVFRLIGNRYREQLLTGSRFWIPEIQLSLGLWEGAFLQNQRLWLRWYDINGNLIPTPEEFERQRAQLESQRAEFERQQAEIERQQAESESQRAESERQRAEFERQRAESESQRAELESQRAESESRRANQLADRLRAMGINPDEL